MDEYLKLVCTHVNKQREEYEISVEKQKKAKRRYVHSRAQGRSQGAQYIDRSRSKSPPAPKTMAIEDYRTPRGKEKDTKESIQRRPNHPTEKKNPIVSCKMITVRQYERINSPRDRIVNTDEVVKVLAEIDLDILNFQNLDYLFITADNSVHTLLVGVAPKQRFIFALNTIPRSDADTPMSFNKWPLLGVIAITQHLIPDIVLARYNQIPMPDARFWPIFGQWSSRSMTKDMSPNGPQQCDGQNCGAFVITNAFCLAFGYRILCYSEDKTRNDLEYWKKARVVFKLRQAGFYGDFAYDLLDIEPLKVNVPSYGPLLENSDDDNDSDEDVIEYARDPTQPAFIMDDSSEDSNVDEAGDSSMAYTILENVSDHRCSEIPGDSEEYDTDQGSEGSDGGGDLEDLGTGPEIDESRRFYTASEALMHESPRVEPQEDTHQYPSQIGPTFMRAGVFYPIPNVNYQPGLNYSKAELKQACRDFPLIGWKRHSRDTKQSFLRWMLNEMGP